MITQEVISCPVIPYKKLCPSSVDEFLEIFEDVLDLDLKNGMDLDFMIDSKMGNNKISPTLVLARPWDAEEITKICKEVYEGTYPYKEIEDKRKVRKMIESSEHHFILFKVGDHVAGCFRCSLDFEHKKGYTGGFMVKKEFQKTLDVTKSIIGSYAWMWSSYKEEILIWYCENRTAHAASQYITSVCGINTVAFFPNKDMFYDQVESDVMGVIYQEKALSKHRKVKTPTLIRNALDSFLHCDNLYGLGGFNLVSPDLTLDYDEISKLNRNFRKDVITDKYGYRYYQFFLSGTKSYFTFLHTPNIQNIEKTKYHVDSLEELYVYLEEFLKCMKQNSIRYSEVFVSAFSPEHQQLFYEFGFRARGYVPCWSYSKTEGAFEDYVVFNYFEGDVPQAELLPVGQDLLNILNLQINI
ncbi:MAG: hypothetical protein KGD61_01070 [Candidatus Lokiarchaeota archaeon]|nr:hypothetical protein [Candidatus Lokiarchaeota archaeon]